MGMGKGYIVIAKRKAGSKPEVVTRVNSNWAAEEYAQKLHSDLQLDTVMVAEICFNPDTRTWTKLRSVMKIERTCKHPNIQAELFLKEEDCIGWKCMKCGMVLKPELINSKFE